MSVIYKVITRPTDPRVPNSPKRFYPHLITLGQSVNLKYIAQKMQDRSSLSVGDIKSVIQNFVEKMKEQLLEGKSVNIEGLGVFMLTARSKGAELAKDINAKSVESVRIFFQANKELRVTKTATRADEKLDLISLDEYLKKISITVLPEEPEKEEVETTENQDASELEVIESQEEEPEVDIEKIAESIPDIEEIQVAGEAQPEEIPSEQEVAENVQKEASETAEDLGKTAIFTIPKADIETGNNTGEVVVDEELPNIDAPEIDLETGIPEQDLGEDTKNAEESTENENAESVDAEKSESTENEEAVQEEPAQDNSINLDIHSTKDLSAKVEVISGTDWEQPEYEEKLEEEEEQLEVAKEEAEEGAPERTSEGELLNRILNKNNEEIPEPELVATEEELSVFKNFFNVEGLEDNIQEVVKELIAGYTPNGKSTDGNVVILGEEKTGKTSLAVEIIKLVNKKRGRRNRRLAKIDATALNKRGFRNSLNKLLGSDLIVENAEKLGAMILSEVVDVSGMFTDDMLIILEGETEPMEKMLKDSPRLSKVFNHVIRIKQYDIKEWVEYGKRYAKDKGYVMEELASLAFYKAIDDYFGEHKGIGRADVEKLVDTAIANSHKLGRKLSGLFSSNKNDDGLYILIESDFIF